MLPPDVLKRRIHAARLLRGLDQDELGALFEKDGLGKTDAGRIERGNMDMQRAHEDAFVRNLRIPRTWLNVDEDQVDDLVGWLGHEDQDVGSALDQINLATTELRKLLEQRVGISLPSEDDVDPPDDLRRELEEESPSEVAGGQSDAPEGRPAGGEL